MSAMPVSRNATDWNLPSQTSTCVCSTVARQHLGPPWLHDRAYVICGAVESRHVLYSGRVNMLPLLLAAPRKLHVVIGVPCLSHASADAA